MKTAAGVLRGAWVVDYADHARERRLKTFDQKKDAEAFKTTVRGEVREGTHFPVNAAVTVKEADDRWLESGTAAGLEPTTLDQYRQHLTLLIGRFLGRRRAELSVPVVRAFQNRLRVDRRSSAMIKRVTASLGSIVADAQERGLVACNPVGRWRRDGLSRGSGGGDRAKPADQPHAGAMLGKATSLINAPRWATAADAPPTFALLQTLNAEV
jgi:integrase